MKDDMISRQAALDALDQVAQMFPYRIPGDAKTYRQYNEAWNDAIDAAENALEALPPAQPEPEEFEWCHTCREYDQEKHCCHRWTKVIRKTVDDMKAAQPGWIPVTERHPENEQEVFVTVEVRPFGRKPFRKVVRAFYTDGRHTDADSAYSWDEFPDPQYDDDDNLIIPEGWWESSDYSEQQGMIDDFVMAWRELKPWEGGQDG